MHLDLTSLIDAFDGLNVLVVGDPILDRYLGGSSVRFCREALVPNVTISERRDVAGGAANVAINARALGAQVEYLGVLGADEQGQSLLEVLRAREVGVGEVILAAGRSTHTKHRVVADSQLLISFDTGDTTPIDGAAERALGEALERLHARSDIVIVSDYCYGTLTDAFIERLTRLQRARPRILVVDSRHRLPAFREAGVSAVKPNFQELTELLGPAALDASDGRAAAVAKYAHVVLERTGARLAAVTLDRDGAVLIEPGRPLHRAFSRPVLARSSAGAGDTFVAAMALALARGAPLDVIGQLANAAASVVVAKEGTSVCHADELKECFSPAGKRASRLEALARRVELYKEQGRRVVFTNGCFDILHRGHVTLLNQAKALGDVLIVGVNSDASIRRLKGPARPINSLEDRLQVLAALGCVDHVIGFDEDTSENLVRALKPHVFVKGGDYTRETLPEAPLVESLGGVVHVLPYLEDRSTTGLIERIRDSLPPRPDALATGALAAGA